MSPASRCLRTGLGGALLLSGLVGCATGQPAVIGVHTQERDAGSVVDHGRVLDRLPALKSRLKGVRPEQQLLVSASDFTPFETVTVDGVPFQIGVNDHGCVVYVATSDPRVFDAGGDRPRGDPGRRPRDRRRKAIERAGLGGVHDAAVRLVRRVRKRPQGRWRGIEPGDLVLRCRSEGGMGVQADLLVRDVPGRWMRGMPTRHVGMPGAVAATCPIAGVPGR